MSIFQLIDSCTPKKFKIYEEQPKGKSSLRASILGTRRNFLMNFKNCHCPPPQIFCMIHKPQILQSRHIVELKCFIESLYAHITIGFTVQLVSD